MTFRRFQDLPHSISGLGDRITGLEKRHRGLTLEKILTFTSVGSTSFVKGDHPGLRAVLIEVQGGGGAGGGRTTSASGGGGPAGGGGGGGYMRRLVLDAELPSSVTVTVGAGGVGVSQANGGDGGLSSFGGLGTGFGGGGGIRNQGFAGHAAGGAGGGGTTTGQTIQISGQDGQSARCESGISSNMAHAHSGSGGDSVLGHGKHGHPPGSTGNGQSGRNYGGGGSGALGGSTLTGPGGTGGQGIVIVHVYV